MRLKLKTTSTWCPSSRDEMLGAGEPSEPKLDGTQPLAAVAGRRAAAFARSFRSLTTAIFLSRTGGGRSLSMLR